MDAGRGAEAGAGSRGAVALALEGVRKAFRGLEVLRDLSLAVREGEVYTLLGSSGSGKSVTLKIAIGLIPPDAGEVRVYGRPVSGLVERELVEIRKLFGMVFQGAALFDSMTVFENVAYPLREHLDPPPAELRQRVEACLEAVGLPRAGPLMPAELSGGMRKRVGVARAIALEPRIVLYDEPTTGLDPGNSLRIGRLILELRERLGMASVVVTHDLALCEQVSDRVGLLHRGVLAVEGGPRLLRESDHPSVRAFLTGEEGDGPPRDPRGSGEARAGPARAE